MEPETSAIALAYIGRLYEHELKIFLSDPQVPIDTNNLERALRTIPMGRNQGVYIITAQGEGANRLFHRIIVDGQIGV